MTEAKKATQQALYRKYRSKSFTEVIGQKHITELLERAISQQRINHAYLLTGPRGVGKTSVARILAHQINQIDYQEDQNHPDIIEIDAASNRRIDDMRELRDKAQIAPVSARYKIYIIDEVHMLTGESFNAFLKTLEEPPAHVIFILATTDAHKLPSTITSRTQQFSFRAISSKDIYEHLQAIAKQEKIKIDDAALQLIAEHGDGSFRDSIGLLDQLSSLSQQETVSASKVEEVLGLAPQRALQEILQATADGQSEQIIKQLEKLEQRGISASDTARQLLRLILAKPKLKLELLTLADELINIPRSPNPTAKLLTTLLLAATKSAPKSAASQVFMPSATLKLTEPKSSKIAAKPKKRLVEPTTTPSKKKIPAKSVEYFDWQKFILCFKEDNLALFSVLAKCKSQIEQNQLQIYTGSNFWKKKLDASKYQPLLNQALQDLGFADLSFETIGTQLPPQNSQAAKIAAIMGGGEEITLEDQNG